MTAAICRAALLAVALASCDVAAAQTPIPASTPLPAASVPASAPVTCDSALPSGLQRVPIDESDFWSPVGGDVSLTLHGNLPANAVAIVCFRWQTRAARLRGREPAAGSTASVESEDVRNTVSDRNGVRSITASVPDLGAPPADAARTAFGAVPLVSLRVLIVDPATNTVLAADATRMGITSAAVALLATLVFSLLAFCALALMAPNRALARNWFLRILAAKDGHASISQFQLLLWTFVVGASAVYVMSLSGELVEIKSNLLVLLGISGAANLGARVTGTPAAATVAVKPVKPSWADLVMNDGQIDPTRVQMLFFTLITAAFVLISVSTLYELPEIPQSFMILMGVSNSLYVGAKVVTPGAQPGAGETPAVTPPGTPQPSP